MPSDLLDRVAELNPAPARALSDRERAASAELLYTILSTADVAAGSTHPRRRRRVLLIAAAAAVAVTIALTATLISSGPHAPTSEPEALGPQGLSAASLASWTAAPASLPTTAPVIAFCENRFHDQGKPTLSSRDLRGDVGSVIVTERGLSIWCLMGADGIGMSVPIAVAEPADAPPFLGSGQVRLGGAIGSHGLTGPGLSGRSGFAFATGRAAPDVKKIVISDPDRSVTATLDRGVWTAWWPVADYEGAFENPTRIDVAVTLSTGAVVHHDFASVEAQSQ